jgi:hypothetical protein
MKLTYKTTWSFDGDNDVELEILYEYTPPSPQHGPSGGEPAEYTAEYTEVEVISLLIDGVPATHDQLSEVDECERLYDKMSAHAADTLADEQAAAEEYRNELRGE